MTDDEREDKKIIHISKLLNAIESGDYTEEPDEDDFSVIEPDTEAEQAGEDEEKEPQKPVRKRKRHKRAAKRQSPPDREASESESGSKNRSHGLRGVWIALFFALLLASLLVFAYGDRLFGVSSTPAAQETSQPDEANIDFSYENGSSQTFALAGDGLAVASESGFELFDSSGKSVFHKICSPDSPAVAAGAKRAVFYDVGGTLCTAVDQSGAAVEISSSGGIISASVSASGYFAVISENAGTKGLVSVYNGNAALVYEWYSGSGYPLRADLSPDGQLLAVLTVDASGSRVHIFRLTSEDELCRIDYDGELLFDLCFMSQREICIVGSDGVFFADTSGEKTGEFGFSGRYLAGYSTDGSGFAALFLSTYRTGTGGELISVDETGTVLGSMQTESDITAVSAAGRHILAVRPDGLDLYSPSMSREKSEDMLITARRVLLRPRGDVLLLSLYGAERFSF